MKKTTLAGLRFEIEKFSAARGLGDGDVSKLGALNFLWERLILVEINRFWGVSNLETYGGECFLNVPAQLALHRLSGRQRIQGREE